MSEEGLKRLEFESEAKEAPEPKVYPIETKSRLEILRSKLKLGLGVVLVVGVGVFSGHFLAERKVQPAEITQEGEIPKIVTKGEIVGSTDVATFKDQAVGILEKNEDGAYSEGTHKLIREGGPSQTAYLISSVIDLNQFLGRKVEVWGETFHSDKVGWLMDVGRLKVLE